MVGQLQSQIETLSAEVHQEKSKRTTIEERQGTQSKISQNREKNYAAELEKARKELAEQKESSQSLREKLLWLRAALRKTHIRARESKGEKVEKVKKQKKVKEQIEGEENGEDESSSSGSSSEEEEEIIEVDVNETKYDEEITSYLQTIEVSIVELFGNVNVQKEKVKTLETQHNIVQQEKSSIETKIDELQQALHQRDATYVELDLDLKKHKEKAEKLEATSGDHEKEVKKHQQRLKDSETELAKLQSEVKRLQIQLKEVADVSPDTKVEFTTKESENMDQLVNEWSDTIEEVLGSNDVEKVNRDDVREEILLLLAKNNKYQEWVVEVGIEEETVFTTEITRRIIENNSTEEKVCGIRVTHENKKHIAIELHELLVREVITKIELADEDVAEDKVCKKMDDKIRENEKKIQENVKSEERDAIKELIHEAVEHFDKKQKHHEGDECVPREEQKRIVEQHAKDIADKILERHNEEPKKIVEEYLHEQFKVHASAQKQTVIVKEHKETMKEVNEKLNGLRLLLGIDEEKRSTSTTKTVSSTKEIVKNVEMVEKFIIQINELQKKIYDNENKQTPVEFIEKMKRHIYEMEKILHIDPPKGDKKEYDLLAEIRTEVDFLSEEHRTMEQVVQVAESKVRETLHKSDYKSIRVTSKKKSEPIPYPEFVDTIMHQYEQQHATSEKQATLLWMMMKLLRSNTHALNQAKEDMKGLEQNKDIKVEQLLRENQDLASQVNAMKHQMMMMQTFSTHSQRQPPYGMPPPQTYPQFTQSEQPHKKTLLEKIEDKVVDVAEKI